MMHLEERQCPVCKLDQSVSVHPLEDRIALKCKRCGDFTITGTAAEICKGFGSNPKLSGWIRQRTDLGSATLIKSETLKEISEGVPDYSVSEKQLMLLRALEQRNASPGHLQILTPDYDYPLAWSAQAREFVYHLESLADRGLVRVEDKPLVFDSLFPFKVIVTSAGWAFLDEHARASVISDQVFVAMSFHATLTPAWEDGIRPALAGAKFKPYRVDAEPHNDRIDAKIITEIKNSRFLVADVTQQRPGVYFEAGYAIGLGLPVIWCVRSDDLVNVHFDTRQYNHIVWDTPKQLAEKLYFNVCAIIGTGASGL